MPAWRPPPITRRSFLGGALALGASTLVGCSTPRTAATVQREQIAYGDAASQIGSLSLPRLEGPRPVIVLVHGGYWKLGINHLVLEELADDLASSGFAVWNIDYRRIGEGGGWTATFDDVAAAVDHVAELAARHPLDPSRIGIVGHSAGGHLALWAAGRATLPAGAAWSAPAVTVDAAVSLAGIADLELAATSPDPSENAVKLRDSVVSLLGATPEQVPERYRAASPIQRLPLGIPQLLVHGAKDDVVPIEQSRTYVAAVARTADRIRLIELPSADHADIVHTGKPGWAEVLTWLRTNVGEPGSSG